MTKVSYEEPWVPTFILGFTFQSESMLRKLPGSKLLARMCFGTLRHSGAADATIPLPFLL